MFADFFVVLISYHSFELHQGLGTSCDVTAGYLRDDVIEGSCWIGPAEHAHVRRRWSSEINNKQELPMTPKQGYD